MFTGGGRENFLADFYIKSIMCFRNKLLTGKDFMSHLILQISIKRLGKTAAPETAMSVLPNGIQSFCDSQKTVFVVISNHENVELIFFPHGCKMRGSSSIV